MFCLGSNLVMLVLSEFEKNDNHFNFINSKQFNWSIPSSPCFWKTPPTSFRIPISKYQQNISSCCRRVCWVCCVSILNTIGSRYSLPILTHAHKRCKLLFLLWNWNITFSFPCCKGFSRHIRMENTHQHTDVDFQMFLQSRSRQVISHTTRRWLISVSHDEWI